MTALVGASGSGKSTMLNCIGLLSRPTSGTISFAGTDLLSLSASAGRRFRRDRLGYLFQNYALIEDTTVEGNLKVATRAHRLRGRAAEEAMHRSLSEVGLGDRLRDPVSQLSGGEQQRVSLARLLIRRPALVLADEPTGALDGINAARVVGYLRAIAEGGAVVVIATHDQDVRDACDATLDLCEGAVVSG